MVSEKDGVWGRAEEIPGLAALRTGRFASVLSLSCARPGDCGAGGSYEETSFVVQGFVVSDTHGAWRRAEEVPGLAALNMNGDATISSVSCTAPGECSAGGVLRRCLRVSGLRREGDVGLIRAVLQTDLTPGPRTGAPHTSHRTLTPCHAAGGRYVPFGTPRCHAYLWRPPLVVCRGPARGKPSGHASPQPPGPPQQPRMWVGCPPPRTPPVPPMS